MQSSLWAEAVTDVLIMLRSAHPSKTNSGLSGSVNVMHVLHVTPMELEGSSKSQSELTVTACHNRTFSQACACLRHVLASSHPHGCGA